MDQYENTNLAARTYVSDDICFKIYLSADVRYIKSLRTGPGFDLQGYY